MLIIGCLGNYMSKHIVWSPKLNILSPDKKDEADTTVWYNPQSDYYSMFYALNNRQGIDIFPFHGKIRSLKKNNNQKRKQSNAFCWLW